MEEDTIKLLMRALGEELESRVLKQSARQKTEPAEEIGPWISAKKATSYFGIPKGRLIRLVMDRKIVAKKFDASDPNSCVRFRTADIEAAYDSMPDYHFETRRKNTNGEKA